LDEHGTLVPNADNVIHFSISGEVRIAGVDNGLPTSDERFLADEPKAFFGLCLAVIRSSGKAGRITLHAISEGLKESSIVIDTQ
jgi:beta-galactosidase